MTNITPLIVRVGNLSGVEAFLRNSQGSSGVILGVKTRPLRTRYTEPSCPSERNSDMGHSLIIREIFL